MYWLSFATGGVVVGGLLIIYGLMSISSNCSRQEEQREIQKKRIIT